MSYLPPLIEGMLSRAQRRFNRARPGSVLILVVALLVLLALIGTAYISGTRTERYASEQNVANTQIDLIVQGIENLISGSITGKLYGTTATGQSVFRPASDETNQFAYTNFESALTDTYLGSRIPEISAAIAPINTIPIWKSVSFPVVPAGQSPNSLFYEFDGLGTGTKVALVWLYDTSATTRYMHGDIVAVSGAQPLVFYTPIAGGANDKPGGPAGTDWVPVDPKQAFEFVPTSTVSGTQSVPGFAVYNIIANGFVVPSANPRPGTAYAPAIAGNVIPAVDSDGDGIADAGLFKLPFGQLDGVTYYAALRVIDGNSAVNASIAWNKQNDLDPVGVAVSTYMGIFRSHVGLQQLLDPVTAAAEMNALNSYRFNDSRATPMASAIGVYDPVTVGFNSPANDRPDFKFLTQGDALENQLARRPLYPGYNVGATGQYNQYRWLGNNATAALAHRFCINSGTGTLSEIEKDLPAELSTGSLAVKIPTTPYAPSNVGGPTAPGTWYGDNFDFAPAVTRPLRSVLVGSNPVSNAVSGHYTALGPWSSPPPVAIRPDGKYHFGDWVTIGGYSFVCLQDHVPALGTNDPKPAMAAASWTPTTARVASDAFWAFVPWSTVPVKTSANTATFGALWAAYWNVMWDHPSTTANGFAQPAFGYPLNAADPNTNQVANQINPVGTSARMFRSPIRDPNATPQFLTPGQTMLLRSALAAINTLSIRAASGSALPNALDNVLSRQITIPSDPAAPGSLSYDVMLFGATKQPYISEVYVENGTAGINFIGIELSNPYPTAMPLTAWQIAWMDRTSGVGYATGATPGAKVAAGAGVQIPIATPAVPGATGNSPGKLILYDGAAPTGFPPPASPSVQYQSVPGLAGAVGEIEILRPRINGNPQPASAIDMQVNNYDEGTAIAPNYLEMVPVDQIDLTGLAASTTYGYRRATTPGTNSWNFVYSGGYLSTAVAPIPRPAGLVIIPTGQYSFGVDKTSVAFPPAVGTATFTTYPIQIANLDSAGWNQTGVAPQHFPFGGFARNGDLMQVPFIGAYRIVPAGTTVPIRPSSPTRITELNSLPLDSAFADDQEPAPGDKMQVADLTTASPPFREQIGRFCPVGDPAGATALARYDFDPLYPLTTTNIPNSNINWRYHWATKLLDFLTVQSPQDDYLPNTDPLTYPAINLPSPVANRNASVVNARTGISTEDTVPLEGLVNINTAPWPVLAALPLLPASSTANPVTIAKDIVTYRNSNGPFHSLFDLYKVPSFKAANDTQIGTGGREPNVADGDFSPYSVAGVTTDGVRFDFEERFLLINRLSNLLTTRSDSFTCYVLVQGWRNVGSNSPTLVAQRRVAFILDRSASTPTSPTSSTVPVPQN